MDDDPLHVRHYRDAVRIERFMVLGPYLQCAYHSGEFICLHFMVSFLF